MSSTKPSKLVAKGLERKFPSLFPFPNPVLTQSSVRPREKAKKFNGFSNCKVIFLIFFYSYRYLIDFYALCSDFLYNL